MLAFTGNRLDLRDSASLVSQMSDFIGKATSRRFVLVASPKEYAEHLPHDQALESDGFGSPEPRLIHPGRRSVSEKCRLQISILQLCSPSEPMRDLRHLC